MAKSEVHKNNMHFPLRSKLSAINLRVSRNQPPNMELMAKINIDVVYNRMIKKLKASEYSDEIQGIEKSSAGAATGSEALMDQGFYLINLRYSSPSAFKLIESEINDYLNYCKQNGLLIRR